LLKIKKKKIKVDFKIIGTPNDNWFGNVSIFEKKARSFSISALIQLAGSVFYKDGNYVVKWNNAYFHADASLFT
jgi:hypothetical protein